MRVRLILAGSDFSMALSYSTIAVEHVAGDGRRQESAKLDGPLREGAN